MDYKGPKPKATAVMAFIIRKPCTYHATSNIHHVHALIFALTTSQHDIYIALHDYLTT